MLEKHDPCQSSRSDGEQRSGGCNEGDGEMPGAQQSIWDCEGKQRNEMKCIIRNAKVNDKSQSCLLIKHKKQWNADLSDFSQPYNSLSL